jgi:hypothetical protein
VEVVVALGAQGVALAVPGDGDLDAPGSILLDVPEVEAVTPSWSARFELPRVGVRRLPVARELAEVAPSYGSVADRSGSTR